MSYSDKAVTGVNPLQSMGAGPSPTPAATAPMKPRALASGLSGKRARKPKKPSANKALKSTVQSILSGQAQ